LRAVRIRENSRGLTSVDRPKVRVIVNPGGTNEQYVRSNVHHAQIVVYPDNRAIFDEITAGHADVMITDDVEAELQTGTIQACAARFPARSPMPTKPFSCLAIPTS